MISLWAVSLCKKRNVFLVAAHPDDESISVRVLFASILAVWTSGCLSYSVSNPGRQMYCLPNSLPLKALLQWLNMRASGFGFGGCFCCSLVIRT